jgi:hypothetical protein
MKARLNTKFTAEGQCGQVENISHAAGSCAGSLARAWYALSR